MILVAYFVVKRKLVTTFSLIVLLLSKCGKIFIRLWGVCPNLALIMWLTNGRNINPCKLKICLSQLLSGLSGDVEMICALTIPHGWECR